MILWFDNTQGTQCSLIPFTSPLTSAAALGWMQTPPHHLPQGSPYSFCWVAQGNFLPETFPRTISGQDLISKITCSIQDLEGQQRCRTQEWRFWPQHRSAARAWWCSETLTLSGDYKPASLKVTCSAGRTHILRATSCSSNKSSLNLSAGWLCDIKHREVLRSNPRNKCYSFLLKTDRIPVSTVSDQPSSISSTQHSASILLQQETSQNSDLKSWTLSTAKIQLLKATWIIYHKFTSEVTQITSLLQWIHIPLPTGCQRDLLMGTEYFLQSRQEPSLINHHTPEAPSAITNETSEASLKSWVCYIKF